MAADPAVVAGPPAEVVVVVPAVGVAAVAMAGAVVPEVAGLVVDLDSVEVVLSVEVVAARTAAEEVPAGVEVAVEEEDLPDGLVVLEGLASLVEVPAASLVAAAVVVPPDAAVEAVAVEMVVVAFRVEEAAQALEPCPLASLPLGEEVGSILPAATAPPVEVVDSTLPVVAAAAPFPLVSLPTGLLPWVLVAGPTLVSAALRHPGNTTAPPPFLESLLPLLLREGYQLPELLLLVLVRLVLVRLQVLLELRVFPMLLCHRSRGSSMDAHCLGQNTRPNQEEEEPPPSLRKALPLMYQVVAAEVAVVVAAAARNHNLAGHRVDHHSTAAAVAAAADKPAEDCNCILHLQRHHHQGPHSGWKD